MKKSVPSPARGSTTADAHGPEEQAARSRESDSAARPAHSVVFCRHAGTLTSPSGWLVVVLVIAGVCALAWQWRVAHSSVHRTLPVEPREPQSY